MNMQSLDPDSMHLDQSHGFGDLITVDAESRSLIPTFGIVVGGRDYMARMYS
jgi:hypothetical protein